MINVGNYWRGNGVLKRFIIMLFFKLIKNYSIFFFFFDEAYYVNDVCVDFELKEIILKYEQRGEDIDEGK